MSLDLHSLRIVTKMTPEYPKKANVRVPHFWFIPSKYPFTLRLSLGSIPQSQNPSLLSVPCSLTCPLTLATMLRSAMVSSVHQSIIEEKW